MSLQKRNRSSIIHRITRLCGAIVVISAFAGSPLVNHCARAQWGGNGGGWGGGGGSSVPEIDAGIAVSALTLLGGAVLLLANRLRRRRSSQ